MSELDKTHGRAGQNFKKGSKHEKYLVKHNSK